jgi:acetaldehyde dehydrogenase (acetylating)
MDCSGEYTIPITKTGTFYIGAIADDRNMISEGRETNNTFVGIAPMITVRDKYPDLVITEVSCTHPVAGANVLINSGDTISTGEAITCKAKVKNQGTYVADTYFYSGIKLATNAALTTGVVPIASCYSSVLLAPGDTMDCSGEYTIPITKTGTFYIGAIADDRNMILESNDNETNNTLVGIAPMITVRDKYPDLVVTEVSCTHPVAGVNVLINSGDTISTGETISCKAKVKNQGNYIADSYFYSGFKLATNAALTTGVVPIVDCYSSVLLAPEDTMDCSGQYTIPITKTGTFYIGAIADDRNMILESNDHETNNTLVGVNFMIAAQ